MQPLTEKDVEGLRKSIEIVQKYLYLCTEKQKEIGDGLQKAIKILNAVEGKKITVSGAEGKEEKEEKTAKELPEQLKKDGEELLSKLKEQKKLFEDFQKEEVIETGVDAKLEKILTEIGVKKVRYAQEIEKKPEEKSMILQETKKDIKAVLEQILDFIKIEERMGIRQARALSNFLKVEEEIKTIVKNAKQIRDSLLELAKGQANEENPLYVLAKQLGILFDELKNIEEAVSKEDGAVRLMVQAMEERKKREAKTKTDVEQAKKLIESFTSINAGINITQEIAKIEENIRGDIETIKQADAGLLYGIGMLKDIIEKKLLPTVTRLIER